MADDSWDIDVNMDFHSCDKPHGMKDYVLSDLTLEQQRKLNERKREQIRTDQSYLAEHPEIRGIIIMILRMLMRTKPKYNIFETIGKYFTKSSVDVQEDIINYLKERDELLASNSILMTHKKESFPSYISAKISMDKLSKKEEEEEERYVEEEAILEEELAVWKMEDMQEKEEETNSTEKICQEILNEILDVVTEKIDLSSLDSITTEAFPLVYEDHTLGSEQGSLESDELTADLFH